jgi:hypothetical protein
LREKQWLAGRLGLVYLAQRIALRSRPQWTPNMPSRTSKELLRHALLLAGLNGLVRLWRVRVKHSNENHMFLPRLADRFSYIYKNGIWQIQGDATPGSGPGSSLEATRDVCAKLAALLDDLQVNTLLDLGCGDFTWMSKIGLSQSYIGADIVASVIENNQRLYGNESRRFIQLDATCDPLPVADAILCREVLFHLSFKDIRKVLSNVTRSGAEYFIATTDRATSFNADIVSGDFRVLNLYKRPFKFSPSIATIPDESVVPGRSLEVWIVSSLTP